MVKKAGKLFPFILTVTFGLLLAATLSVRYSSDTRISLSEQYAAVTSPWVKDGKININTATEQMLMQIPGIGTTLSQRIVEYRETHGQFSSVSELINVKGIGQKTLESILEYITTGDSK